MFIMFTGTLARSNAYYGRGSGLIMLTNIGCTGEELNLLNCTHYGYGVTSCSHYEDAGVHCPGRRNDLMHTCASVHREKTPTAKYYVWLRPWITLRKADGILGFIL